MLVRGTILGLAVLAAVLVAAVGSGCGGDEVTCGDGTVRVGDSCLAIDDGSGTTPMADGGTVTTPGGGGTGSGGGGTGSGGGGTGSGGGGTGSGGGDADGGAGFGTSPPGDGGTFAGPPGCDMASGECDEWEQDILAGLRERQAAAGCSAELVDDPRVDAVAERHAQHQADVDMLDSSSPDGNLFDQIADEGVRFRLAAAMFSVTRLGADDVLERWDDNPDVDPLMDRCGYMTGVGIATSETEASYVTVLMVKL